MVALVGDSGWQQGASGGGHLLDWPAGAGEGDVAFLLIEWEANQWNQHHSEPRFSGWTSEMRTVVGSREYGGRRARWWIYSRVLGSGSLPSVSLGSSFVHGRLVVFTDTRGIGRRRSGVGAVPVAPYGGVFAAGVGSTGTGDLTFLAPDGPLFDMRAGWAATTSGSNSLGNIDWGSSGSRSVRAIELLPPEGPGAPVWLTPGDGDEVANTGTVDYSWQYRPSQAGGRQDAYRLAFLVDDEWLYWHAATGTFVTYEAINESAVTGASIDAPLLPGNVPLLARVWAREAIDGRWSEQSVDLNHMAVTPPSVDVTGPGSAHDDLSPTVTWEASTPRGQQTAFRVQVAHLGGLVYDSGVQPGDGDQWTVPPQEWDNGSMYQARVQVQQTGGSWSSWSTLDFPLTWTEPAVPDVDAWPVADGVLVRVAADASLSVDLERITSQGLWVRVGSFQMPVDGAVTVTDVRAPYGQVAAYRARAANELDGMPLVSGWGLSGQVVNRARWSYLMAASSPLSTWLRVLIREDGVHTHHRPTSVAYGLGDSRARVSYAPERGRSGTLTLHALTQEDREGLLGLLYAGETLILRLPAEAHLDGPGYVGGGELVFDVAGEVQVARVTTGPLQRRELTVSWVEQEAPAPLGGTSAPVTRPVGEVVGG